MLRRQARRTVPQPQEYFTTLNYFFIENMQLLLCAVACRPAMRSSLQLESSPPSPQLGWVGSRQTHCRFNIRYLHHLVLSALPVDYVGLLQAHYAFASPVWSVINCKNGDQISQDHATFQFQVDKKKDVEILGCSSCWKTDLQKSSLLMLSTTCGWCC